jgi:hypothetical protein
MTSFADNLANLASAAELKPKAELSFFEAAHRGQASVPHEFRGCKFFREPKPQAVYKTKHIFYLLAWQQNKTLWTKWKKKMLFTSDLDHRMLFVCYRN